MNGSECSKAAESSNERVTHCPYWLPHEASRANPISYRVYSDDKGTVTEASEGANNYISSSSCNPFLGRNDIEG
jgi:hypothetical protein